MIFESIPESRYVFVCVASIVASERNESGACADLPDTVEQDTFSQPLMRAAPTVCFC